MVHTDSESNPSLAVTRMPVHGLIFLHFLDKNSRRKVVVLPLEEAVSDGVHDCEQGALDGAQCRALATLRLGFGATVLQAVSNVHQVPKIMARLNTGRMIQYSRNHNHMIFMRTGSRNENSVFGSGKTGPLLNTSKTDNNVKKLF